MDDTHTLHRGGLDATYPSPNSFLPSCPQNMNWSWKCYPPAVQWLGAPWKLFSMATLFLPPCPAHSWAVSKQAACFPSSSHSFQSVLIEPLNSKTITFVFQTIKDGVLAEALCMRPAGGWQQILTHMPTRHLRHVNLHTTNSSKGNFVEV